MSELEKSTDVAIRRVGAEDATREILRVLVSHGLDFSELAPSDVSGLGYEIRDVILRMNSAK
jgi:hypothetical protein